MQNSPQSTAVERFLRVSGLLFFLFSLLAVIFRIVQFFILGDPPLEELVIHKSFLLLQGIPSLIAAIFFLTGANTLYLRQAEQLRKIGLVIYFIAFSAMVISSGAMWTYAFTTPVLAREAPLSLTSTSSGIIQAVIGSMALGPVGWLILSIVSLRVKMIPRWALMVQS